MTPLEQLEQRIERRPDGCWQWQMKLTTGGYGKWCHDGRVTPAHRRVYELLVGPIPDGLDLDHLCRNRGCVNPEHLEPVTNRENVLRGISPHARNARRTHCAQGHEFTAENIRRDARGHRQCRECARLRSQRHNAAQPKLDRSKCKNGHPRTDEHGYRGEESWVCRTCNRLRARRPGGYLDPERERGTHCPKGHEYTPENTYTYRRGEREYRYCRECNREAARKRSRAA